MELQNTDLWIRPTDLSWHFPILVTIREMHFRNYRRRSSEKLKAREDKIEEATKQKTLKNRDEDWNSARWKQSWDWTTSSSSAAWREWSSDQTSKRFHWQSADWENRSSAQGYGMGRHTTLGNDVIFIDPYRASMATKITCVCDGRLHFAITATCPSDVTCETAFACVVVAQARHFVLPSCECFSMTFAQGHIAFSFICNSVVTSDDWTSLGLSLYSLIILTGLSVSILG